MNKKNKKMGGGYSATMKQTGGPDKPKITDNEAAFRRKKVEGANRAADRVANLKQKKKVNEDIAEGTGKKRFTKKAERIQKKIDRTTKRGERRSTVATAGRSAEELRSIGIEPSKEVKFGGPSMKKKSGVAKKPKKGMGGYGFKK